ncbi:MAG: cupin domain-containing protein [Rhizobiales bacterium]|nr:cupin domain-containing protein [Hyphomicrobiales bacterium]
MSKPSAIRALDVAARTMTIYPPEYAAALAGRAKRALGDQFGLTQFGVNLTTLAPGSWSAERHWHEMEDEFIYVLEGELTLVDDHGEHTLTPGMCAGFKAGVPNGHKLVNKSKSPAAFLELGTRSADERSHYPEADMQGVKAGGKWQILHKDGMPY